jgi:hypothetical protein
MVCFEPRGHRKAELDPAMREGLKRYFDDGDVVFPEPTKTEEIAAPDDLVTSPPDGLTKCFRSARQLCGRAGTGRDGRDCRVSQRVLASRLSVNVSRSKTSPAR